MERRELAALPALLPLLVAGLGGGNASAQGTGAAEAAERAVRDYSDAFNRGDAAAIAGYCHEPFLAMTPQRVTVLATRTEVETAFGNYVRALRARGYSHSTWSELHAKTLGSATAIVSGAAVRHTTAGGELERIGATYLLRKVGDRWEIVVNAGHLPSDVIRM